MRSTVLVVAVVGMLLGSSRGAVATPDTDAHDRYVAALRTMDGQQQPRYLTYDMDGVGDGLDIGLTTIDGKVWLQMRGGSASTHWTLRHRTFDYQSEIVNSDAKRYVSQRSFFDPTWYGAVRAIREGMLNAQDPAAPRADPADAGPLPGATLRPIGAVAAMGSSAYDVYDRGAGACPNGNPGRMLHLVARSHDPLHQLSDVVIDGASSRFCMMRFSVGGGFGFHGIVEQQFADVGGYWMQTGGLLDGTLRVFGISAHHGTWRYRIVNVQFPASLPPDAFDALEHS